MLEEQTVIREIDWVCNSPSPYNDYLFGALHDLLSLPVYFYFTEPASSIHSWKRETNLKFNSRSYRRRLSVDWDLIKRVCLNDDCLFVTNCWQDPTTQLILLFLMLAKRRYVMWNDTPSFIKKRNPIKKLLRKVFLRGALRRAHAVLGTGKTALLALEQMGCPPEKLINFPYFIDNNLFSKPRPLRRMRPIVFGSSGRLHEDKGYDLALQALADLYRNHGCHFRYRIAGSGPVQTALMTMAQDLGIGDLVEFAGWIDSKDLPAFYESIDVFLHPARFEPFGVSVVEAMASSLVVIASDQTAAATDRIDHGVSGFLHPSGNVDGLKSAIWTTLNLSPEDCFVIGAAARASAEEWPVTRGARIVSQLVKSYAVGMNKAVTA